jgi:zinc-ribbon domain
MTSSGYEKLERFGLLSDGINQLKNGTVVDVIGDLIGIAAAVIAILVVSMITERENEIRSEAVMHAPQVPVYAPPVQYAAPPPPPAPTEQRIQCPECAEWIQAQANVCRFCGHRLRPLGQ